MSEGKRNAGRALPRALLLTGLLGLLAACERPADFRLEGLANGDPALRRDEAIVLRFNRALGSVPDGAVWVRGPAGQALPVRVAARGRHLFITPGAPSFWWPHCDAIDLRIQRPLAGRPITAADGSELASDRTLRLGIDTKPLPSRFALVEAPGLGPAETLADDEGLALSFDAPVSEESLLGGLSLQDLEHGRDLLVPARRDPKDWRRVLIPSHVGGSPLLDASSSYRLVVRRALRALDGRRLERAFSLAFHTTANPEGWRTLRIAFEGPPSFSSGSFGGHRLVDGHLQPGGQLVSWPPIEASPATASLLELAGGWNSSQAASIEPFGPRRTRVQFLIPRTWLGEHPALIHGVRLRLARAPVEGARLRDLSMTMGVARQGPDGGPAELGSRFGDVYEPRRMPQRLSLPEASRDLVIGASPQDGSPPTLLIPFAEPYVHEDVGSDLVLELRHAGLESSGPDRRFDRLDLAGIALGPKRVGGPAALLVQQQSSGDPIALPFGTLLHLWLEPFPPAVTRWYLVEDRERPVFEFEDDWLSATGFGRNDLSVSFQAGRPRRDRAQRVLRDPDGFPLCTPLGASDRVGLDGPWDPQPPRDGSRALRVRFDFSPRVGLRRPAPSLEYVQLRYRGDSAAREAPR